MIVVKVVCSYLLVLEVDGCGMYYSVYVCECLRQLAMCGGTSLSGSYRESPYGG